LTRLRLLTLDGADRAVEGGSPASIRASCTGGIALSGAGEAWPGTTIRVLLSGAESAIHLSTAPLGAAPDVPLRVGSYDTFSPAG
jgi:hypothetical protein